MVFDLWCVDCARSTTNYRLARLFCDLICWLLMWNRGACFLTHDVFVRSLGVPFLFLAFKCSFLFAFSVFLSSFPFCFNAAFRSRCRLRFLGFRWMTDGCPFNDSLFLVFDFIRNCGANPDWHRFGAIFMSGGRSSVWDVFFQRNCNNAVGARKKRWGHSHGCGACVCPCIFSSFNTPVFRFEKVDFGMVLLHLVIRELAMSKPLIATELITFLQKLELF